MFTLLHPFLLNSHKIGFFKAFVGFENKDLKAFGKFVASVRLPSTQDVTSLGKYYLTP